MQRRFILVLDVKKKRQNKVIYTMSNCYTEIFGTFLQRHVTALLIIMGIVLGTLQALSGFWFGKFLSTEGVDFSQLKVLLVLVVLNILIRYLYHRSIHRQSNSNSTRLFRNLFQHWNSMSVEQQDANSSQMITALNESFSDADHVSHIIFKNLVLNCFVLVVFIIGFIILKPWYAPVLLMWLGLNALVVYFTVRRVSSLARTYNQDYAQFNREFKDYVLNNWNIRYNGLEDYAQTQVAIRFQQRMDRHTEMVNQQLLFSRIFPVVIFCLFVGLCIWIITHDTRQTTRIYTVLLLMQSYSSYFDFWTNLHDALHAYQGTHTLCKMLSHPTDDTTESTFNQAIRSVRFEHCGFRYKNTSGQSMVVNDMSFDIAAGETVAIMGPSGCGKSTAVHLLLGMLKPSTGAVLINGRSVTAAELQPLVGVVPQRVQLFHQMTVQENIVLKHPLDTSRLNLALQTVSLDQGFATRRSTELSLGQKQRVLIARMLYRPDCSMYIMDEYLSAVDQTLADTIHQAILHRIENERAIGVLVTHNAKLAERCTRVIHMTAN